MTNENKLRGRMAEMGYNLTSLSEAISISRPALRKRLANTSDFRVSEIERVCDVLQIPKKDVSVYFFSPDVPILETR